ncbi:DUF3883 domain-containing protein [Cytophagaceae bacterium YF14B1]|uniref:DUF3883 domain-containing protein n=1 Tax=Xanthocytophaga flava TaxID=3048013 RepID=A0AAE3QLC7_9BACT|nr:DUF3883 domain-containing protein [Xanthocytophaga flavus]MDJ1478854.1 DUF3883 domain-containing protein [Xanthocytophaga flavus]
MNLHELREAQVRYENRKEEVLNSREKLYQLRSAFVKYFNHTKIASMQIDDYVAGVDLPEKGFNFCYGLERQLDGLGRIIGATAFKFGVYYGRTKSDSNYEYRFTQKFGNTYQEAFENVREAILQLLDAGGNIDKVIKNPLSAMFKGKILCTYFPERYLNIFSHNHLNYYLTQLDLDTVSLIESDPVHKREALIAFKNQDAVMKNWSVDLFAAFLYSEYPGRPPKDNQDTKNNDTLADYRIPSFPSNPTPTFIDLKILSPNSTNTTNIKHGGGKMDYEKKERINKKLGDRGEKIVMDLEKTRLINAGQKALANKIERVSLISDSYGYDIVSFDDDGTERYIEVKATRSKVGVANFFFTANELQKAQKTDNYYIYMVYEVTTEEPKVWAIKNPFNPENKNVIKTPINYRVTINAEKLTQ